MSTDKEKRVAEERDRRLAEIGGMTDEQVGANIVDSLQTAAGVVGILRIFTRWVRDIRESEQRKASKGAAVGAALDEEPLL